jgi:hypothetical protein
VIRHGCGIHLLDVAVRQHAEMRLIGLSHVDIVVARVHASHVQLVGGDVHGSYAAEEIGDPHLSWDGDGGGDARRRMRRRSGRRERGRRRRGIHISPALCETNAVFMAEIYYGSLSIGGGDVSTLSDDDTRSNGGASTTFTSGDMKL